MKIPAFQRSSLAALIALGLALPAQAQDAAASAGQSPAAQQSAPPAYSPYAGHSYPTRPLFGDTHTHTSYSMDAGAAGDRLGPDEAFRFAQGEEVKASGGQPAKLSRPLDFLVVADHAEAFGAFSELLSGNPRLLADPTLKRWHDLIQMGGANALKVVGEIRFAAGAGKIPKILASPQLTQAVWDRHVAIADRHNQPGRFSAMIGFEWSSRPGGDTLHRVVVFRDAADKARQTLPFSLFQSENPEDLWKWMAAYEAKTGGSVLAIPHNGNASNGRMFALADFLGKPLTRQYAQERALREPLVEVTQIKGDGETHPQLSPNDEFADFERWDKGNGALVALKKPEMLPYEYARSTLKHGLKLEQQLGANPFKFGLIGSTDAHTSLAAVEENNYFGKLTPFEPNPKRTSQVFEMNGETKRTSWEFSASGYAAVWATENSRAAIYDAMQRKEVYATTGPRMTVRLFGGYDFDERDAQAPDLARVGYARGVPMGGDLTQAPAGKAPTFLVAADKDPIGANLDRIQIIKGWLDARGEVHEQVYDVAWGDAERRQPDAAGKLPPVGNSVDIANASYSNSIGDAVLVSAWQDPDFDPAQKAFYYVRVLEIPTPRWTTYDAKQFGLKLPAEVPMVIQERAYTSPIWYTPET